MVPSVEELIFGLEAKSLGEVSAKRCSNEQMIITPVIKKTGIADVPTNLDAPPLRMSRSNEGKEYGEDPNAMHNQSIFPAQTRSYH